MFSTHKISKRKGMNLKQVHCLQMSCFFCRSPSGHEPRRCCASLSLTDPGPLRRPLSRTAARLTRNSGLPTAHAALRPPPQLLPPPPPPTKALLAPPLTTPPPNDGALDLIGSDQSRSAWPLVRGRRRRRGGTACLCDSRNAAPGIPDSGG